MYIKKILNRSRNRDSDERKQWIKIVFGIVLAQDMGLRTSNVSVSEVIYALGILL